MNIQSARLDPEDCVAITNYMTTELYEVPGYRVISWSDVSQMLEHQAGMQIFGCEDEQCFAEIGGALGVDYIVSGDIGALGDRFIMTIRQIDIVRAETVSRVSRRVTGNIGLLIDELPAMVRELFGAETVARTKAEDRADRLGSIYIQSNPSGASVEIDGQSMDVVTPVTLRDIPAGERRIIVRKGNYYGTELINLAPDAIERLNIKMEQGTGTLRVFTEPADVTVKVAGVVRGSTPCVIENVAVGLQQIELVKDGYFVHEKEVEISMDKAVELDVEMKPAAFVSVTVPGHRDARIIINGTTAGLGSVQDYPVEVGGNIVTVSKADYDPWSQRGNVRAGDSITLTADLRYTFGIFEVGTNPPGAAVFLNSELSGTTPLRLRKLEPGEYEIKIEKSNYLTVNDNFTVAKSERVSRNFALEKTEEYKEYLLLQSNLSAKRRQQLRRIIFGVGTLTAGGVGLVRHIQSSEAYETYQDSEIQNVAEHDHNWAVYESLHKKRNSTFFITALMSLGFFISIPF